MICSDKTGLDSFIGNETRRIHGKSVLQPQTSMPQKSITKK